MAWQHTLKYINRTCHYVSYDINMISIINLASNSQASFYNRCNMNIQAKYCINTLHKSKVKYWLNKAHWLIKPGANSRVGIDDNIWGRVNVVLIRFSEYWLMKLTKPGLGSRVDVALIRLTYYFTNICKTNKRSVHGPRGQHQVSVLAYYLTN